MRGVFRKAREGLEQIVSKGAEQAKRAASTGAERAKELYHWVDTYREDIENGILIGADWPSLAHYMKPVQTLQEVLRDEGPTPREFDGYSIGMERAKAYKERRSLVPETERAPISVATWNVGATLGFALSPVLYPLWVHWHNRRKNRERSEQSGVLE